MSIANGVWKFGDNGYPRMRKAYLRLVSLAAVFRMSRNAPSKDSFGGALREGDQLPADVRRSKAFLL